MNFKVNDHVWIIDEDFSGYVKKIEGNVINIETEDGFLLNYKPEELLLHNRNTNLNMQLFKDSNINDIISQKETPKRKPKKRLKPKERFEPTMEVDLHVNQLIKSAKGMTNHDILTLQINTAKHKLEFAISKRIKKVVFIHGVGAGVLKLELEYLFGRYDNIKFYDANYKKYGLGATEIYIFNTPN